MTELQERAIAKIDAEIEKEKGNRILEIIGEFLINLVTTNSDAAEKLLDEKKNEWEIYSGAVANVLGFNPA